MDMLKCLIKRLIGRDPRIKQLEQELRLCQAQFEVLFSDVATFASKSDLPKPGNVSITTEHPVAIASNDHLHPKGTKNDITRHPRFVAALKKCLGNDLAYLDLGCSGGGLVFDFLMRGFEAYGIEGSDYSRKHKRAFWGIIPDRLFTADITKPFQLREKDGDGPKTFRVIGAWEVLEHLEATALESFFRNVRDHLRDDGLFVASVATTDDIDPLMGINWHKTVKPKDWWIERCAAFGFEEAEIAFAIADFPRGSGNPTSLDWNFAMNPEMGFHLVLRKRPHS
ncbi:MAG: hypothetical protein COA65_06825 [Rhodospirillaceae bacterium]|nr:MAG: hypothetical protein COA65_06825 [Rhodospirillaceae bacterium]